MAKTESPTPIDVSCIPVGESSFLFHSQKKQILTRFKAIKLLTSSHIDISPVYTYRLKRFANWFTLTL